MKNFRFNLVLLICSTFIVGCSSDDSDGDTVDNSAILGSYNLTEVNISIPQDPNEDGTSSTNMVEELSCLSGQLSISADGTWDMTLVELSISAVTGDFYAVRCAGDVANNYSGRFSFQNNQLTLDASQFSTFQFNGDILTENINEELPGILTRKFEKQ